MTTHTLAVVGGDGDDDEHQQERHQQFDEERPPDRYAGGGQRRAEVAVDAPAAGQGNRPETASPRVTAGLRWHPDTWPNAAARATSVTPKARTTPRES